MRKVVVLVAVLAFGGILSAGALGAKAPSRVSRGNAHASNSPFKILAIADTTGAGKGYGSQIMLGLYSGAAYVNAHGGVDGHPIKLIPESDNSDPATAVSDFLNYTSSHPAPNMVWPGQESNDISALMPVLNRNHVMSFAGNDGAALLASHASKNYPLEFAAQASTTGPVTAVGQWFKKHGVTNVGILQEELDYTQGETPYAIKAFNKLGISHTVVTFPATAVDLTSELSQLKSDGVTGIFFEGLGPAAGYVLKGRAQVGWNVPLLGDLAASSLDLTTLAPASDLGNVQEVVFRPNTSTNANLAGVRMLQKYAAKFKSVGTFTSIPISTGAAPWDALLLLQQAANQANSIDPHKIANALEHLSKKAQTDPLYVLYKRYSYTPGDHEVVTVSPGDYPLISPGPVSNGQVHPRHY